MDSLSSLLKAVFPCLPIGTVERGIQLPTESAKYQFTSEKLSVQPSPRGGKKWQLSNDEAAESIVSAMLDADKIGPSLDASIQSIVHAAGGWSEYLAKKILAALEAVLKAGEQLSAAMQEAYDKAYDAFQKTEGFAADHPMAIEVLCTVIALGILVVLAPHVVELLGFCAGFGELGPVEGSWAALWQSRYLGMVPKRSLFSYFQRLFMTWKHV